MPQRVTIYAAVLAFAGTAAAVPYVPTAQGPPAGFSGGFGEPTCVECHVGNDINAFGGSVSVEGLPVRYELGAEYLLTIVLSAEETEVAGFQLTSRFAGGAGWGQDAGALAPVDSRVAVKDSAGISYAHQSHVGSTTASSNGSTWTVLWTAPTDGGPVSINAAANSGNADNSPLSDLVYATEVSVPPSR